MKNITYVGSSDIRRFLDSDPTGELEFRRHEPVEVKNEVAKVLLEDPAYAGEFIEGEYVAPVRQSVTPDAHDESIDASGEPISGL